MPSHGDLYLNHLAQTALARLSQEFPPATLAERARIAMRFHFTDARSLRFQEYYVRVTNDHSYFLRQENFFRTFKTQYSLQGIDGRHLALLESNKKRLLRCVARDRLVPLYRQFFADATILHKGLPVQKNLGSFFAKFVHTFNPTVYCALDNPIRELLGLKRESFFQSFLAISAAYRTWISRNPQSMAVLRAAVPTSARRYSDQMTDLKCLDLVFWQRANEATAGDA
jgi:hypothetical protein